MVKPTGPGAMRATCLLVLLAPATAHGHGIGGSATDKSTLEFVPLGIEHMLLGWDHLLFILGIVLLAGSPLRSAKLISLFVAGHSTTLIVATVADWRISATLVDVCIALSVVFIARLGLRGRPKDFFWPGAAILGFGLIHGLGLATRLLDLGIPDDGLVAKTIAFNAGVELGQLAAVLVMFALVTLLASRAPDWPRVRRTISGALAAAGLIAAGVLTATSVAGDSPRADRVGDAEDASCVQRDARPQLSGAGGHPARKFFEPGERVPQEDFGHVLGDGWVIVSYRADLPAADVAALRSWITGSDVAIGAGPSVEQAEALRLRTARRELSCERFDEAQARAFADAWFADVRAGRF